MLQENEELLFPKRCRDRRKGHPQKALAEHVFRQGWVPLHAVTFKSVMTRRPHNRQKWAKAESRHFTEDV